ncbi:Transmembrane emp24 domain-containing protein 6 [Merluccius polli]|uniref:Transmembrane emp24 domain-containing protein 6 n=1 Tax=Merluccius polli TaxID=89951 RepID=A0AA47M5K7_MERPO|nr:Transmembrane emp24 domain-containing protein 6 [Merluccius polli]
MAHQLPSWLLAVILVLVNPARPGPVTDLNPDMADQDLFWGSDQYDFSMVLHGSGQDCFWHFAHKGETFYLTFQVQWVTGIGHDSHLSVTVNSPSSLLVSTVDDARGQVEFKTEETGFYQMCFNNFHNRFGTMQIFLSFGVYYDTLDSSQPGGKKEHKEHKEQKEQKEKEKKEEVRRELNNTLAAIEETSHRVENRVFHMFRFYNFGRMRRSSHYFLLQSSARYVTWWSAAQSARLSVDSVVRRSGFWLIIPSEAVSELLQVLLGPSFIPADRLARQTDQESSRPVHQESSRPGDQ